MSSLRQRLMLTLTSAITLVTLLATSWSYLASREEVEELFDAQLAQHTRIIQQSMSQLAHNAPTVVVPQTYVGNHSKSAENKGHKYESKIGFQIWRNNTLLAKTEHLPDSPIADFIPGYQSVMHGNHAWRVFSYHEPSNGCWYISIERVEIRQELISKIALQSALPILLGAPLSMALIWYLLGHGLRPLRQISQELNRRKAEDLTPIEYLGPTPTELTAIMCSINALFERLKHSFERERRFTADAAHELKTPIATAKLQLQNALNRTPQDPELQRMAHQLNYLQHVVDQLLSLSRIGASALIAQHPVALKGVATETIQALIDNASNKQQDLGLEVLQPSYVNGHATAIGILMRNLVQNAINYSPPGSQITLRLDQQGNESLIDVIDNGPGIPEALRERVFDRFYRVGGDTHQSGTSGSGLGLAIVREIVDMHGGTITLRETQPAPGLHVQIRLPACDENATSLDLNHPAH